MSRTSSFARLARSIRIANFADALRISTPEALERVQEMEAVHARRRASRREFLGQAARAAAVAGLAAAAGPFAASAARPRPSGSLSIGIVGAGMAGLVCAEQLERAGFLPTIYEAEEGRVGGRQWSDAAFLPGMAIEHGGQYIDNLHKQMLARVPADCTLGDYGKLPGETAYHLGGQAYRESVIVDAYRQFVAALRADLQLLSGEVYAGSTNPDDQRVDSTSLRDYVNGANGAGIVADPVLQRAIDSAYVGEYGRELEEQSALNFVQFIHADKRSKMAWFGQFSDERYYVVQGNDRVARGVASGLRGPFRPGSRLTAVQRLSDGRIELTFANRTRVAHDAVVLALPFTVLRSAVTLHRNLGLSAAKQNVIAHLGYGTNAKMAIGFNGTPWRNPSPLAPDGSNGNAYTDGLPAAQVVFPAAPYEGIEAPSPNGRAILVDYSGGRRGAALNPSRPQEEGEAFLASLDVVWPGSQAAAMRDNRGRLSRVRLDHWPSNPNTLGSYTCYLPGQFTTMSGLEGEPAGNLFFAGEHTDSFYSWQGFMEGACLSGIRTAGEILGGG